MFSHIQIAISTLVGAVLAYVVIVAYARWAKIHVRTRDGLLIAAMVGFSILLWREAGNTAALNDDPIPVVSPNDVLCPVVTYVSLGLYAGVGRFAEGSNWQRERALLTLVSLIVNVVTI